MSTIQEYFDLAKHNQVVSDKIESEFPAWSIITKYYSAIHWMNGFLLRKYPHAYYPEEGHRARIDFVLKNEPMFYRQLFHLWTKSESLRYTPPDWKNVGGLELSKHKQNYDFIKVQVNSLKGK